ncbi:MAG: peptidoglycan DD-metalloendopeptidase family protein [Steroidobacteraceae bacterium]|nr:peptidoglycan DD-metalloendopeptidase family protein [Steroidobacteraceae bacterium]
MGFKWTIPSGAPSRARVLQLACCAVLAWAWLQHEPVREPAPLVLTPVGAGTAETSALSKADEFASTLDGSAGAQQAALGGSMALGLSTIEVIVRRNDTLDRIFRRLKLDLADLASLRNLPGLKNGLDRLRPGEVLQLSHRDGTLFGFERKLSPSETLQVVRDDTGFRSSVLENPLEVRERTVRGVIESSLFEAVAKAGAHDQTALALAEIFGWDIDFVLEVQPGDSFAVTYEEFSQDGEYVKDGPVIAALFVNQGREYRAVRYVDPSGKAHYYTPEGRSMYRAFLRTPVEFTRISSRFNPNRRHPILNTLRAHKGVDYAAPIGTPVRAAGDGRVIFAGRKGGYGNVLEIAHSRGVVTVYAHLSRFAKGIHKGQKVTQGSVVAYVGQTGLATGPHLHYEYRVNGVHKNPQTVELPSAEPINPAWREDFEARAALALATLDPPPGPALVSR